MYNTFSLGVIKCDDRLFLDMYIGMHEHLRIMLAYVIVNTPQAGQYGVYNT